MEDLLTKTKHKLEVPRHFNVVLINDDYTPVDFVVDILIAVFNRSENEALSLTEQVHNGGKGIAGTYSSDIAETKAAHASLLAKKEGHPLRIEVQAA